MERIILHSDMNNFYASVECMLNPSISDKIVVVGGSTEQRNGIVLAKNNKAKALGIQTGEVLWQAKQKCKDLVIVPPNYDKYLKFSELAREIYSRYTDLVEPYGMDECWIDVTGSGIYGSGEEIAEQIRKTITLELGLTVSIGVSYNKIFAKLGSDMKKPDAITCIYKDTFKEQIWNLQANELLGVGRATDKKLKKYGIHTIGELANTDEKFLLNLLGINGLKLKQFANGEDKSLVTPTNFVSPIESIGHGITTIEDLVNSAEVWCVILSLVQDIGTKLKKHNKKATGVAISVRNTKLVTTQWQCKLDLPSQNASYIGKAGFELFQKNYNWEHEIRSMSIKAINLVEEDIATQINMFTDVKTIEKQEKLDLAIENIRCRFGKDSIKSAVLFQNLKLPKNLDNGVILPTGMIN